MFIVTTGGKAGVGISAPTALWDVTGSGDNSDIGLQLRSGNSSSTYSSSQIVFVAESSGTYRHSLRSRAVASQALGNSLDFFLWRSTGQPTTMGDLAVMSIQAVTASSATVHIRP